MGAVRVNEIRTGKRVPFRRYQAPLATKERPGGPPSDAAPDVTNATDDGSDVRSTGEKADAWRVDRRKHRRLARLAHGATACGGG